MPGKPPPACPPPPAAEVHVAVAAFFDGARVKLPMDLDGVRLGSGQILAVILAPLIWAQKSSCAVEKFSSRAAAVCDRGEAARACREVFQT